MCWSEFLMMVMQIPAMAARQQLAWMDAATYGNRVHVAQTSQPSFDGMRARLERVAYPKS